MGRLRTLSYQKDAENEEGKPCWWVVSADIKGAFNHLPWQWIIKERTAYEVLICVTEEIRTILYTEKLLLAK